MSLDQQAWWYVDGQWVHPHEATISLNDVAVLRGYSVFESLRTYDRRPFYLNEHLERMYRSASIIELDVPYTREQVAQIITDTIERNTYTHATIRILLTGGVSDDGITPGSHPVLAILITPLGERNLDKFSQGIRLITTHLQRPIPEAKSSSYLTAIRALKDAARRNAIDALFVNEQGHVLESTRSNFFLFHGDTLVTPRNNMLIGITRMVILELAKGRFVVEERPITTAELAQADEAFLTSSSREITPVSHIDDVAIGNGKPGPRTWELEQRLIDLIKRGNF